MCNESDPVSVVVGSWKSVQVANTSVSTEIGNLIFWSCYEVRMRAITVGDGPYSNVTNVRTKEHGELLLLRFYNIFHALFCTRSRLAMEKAVVLYLDKAYRYGMYLSWNWKVLVCVTRYVTQWYWIKSRL